MISLYRQLYKIYDSVNSITSKKICGTAILSHKWECPQTHRVQCARLLCLSQFCSHRIAFKEAFSLGNKNSNMLENRN